MSALLLAAAFLLRIKAARAHFYAARRAGHSRAGRVGSGSLVALGATALALVSALVQPLSAPTELAGSVAAARALTAAPVLVTPTAGAALPSPTVPPVAPPTRMALAPSAAPGPRLTLRAIAPRADAAGLPLGASAEFTRGVAGLMVFYDFLDVSPGASVQHLWFREGGLVHTGIEPMPEGANGGGHVSWKPAQQFETGRYEVRVSLADKPQFVANFIVR